MDLQLGSIGQLQLRAEAEPSGKEGRSGPREPAIRVLVVEDEPSDADLIREALEVAPDRRMVVEVVSRVGEAERWLLTDPPDLVLLDLGLPDAQGLEALDRVLSVARSVPVVVLTGGQDERPAAEAVQRGAQDFLRKDVLAQEEMLRRCIQHSLERHRLLEEAQRQGRLARSAVYELRRLVESNADGMVVIDSGGIILFANRAATAVLGQPEGDLLGSRLPLPEGWQEQDEVELAQGERTRVLELRVAPIEWNGASASLVSLRDVSERREAEHMRERLLHSDRLRSIGQLAAGVAHEINNPAAFVTVNQEALRARLQGSEELVSRLRDLAASLGGESTRQLDELLDSAGAERTVSDAKAILDENRAGLDRIIAIVRSLRGFARVQQGHIELVGVDELIEDACLMVQNEIRHRAELIKELGSPPPIRLDRGRLTQVMVNLLVNAAQAVPDGRADQSRITIRTSHGDQLIRIEVEDTGEGIPEEQRDRIFEPFFTTKGREEGTGLGLSLTAEIIRQHGGEIRVHSEVGEGTRFEILLPEHSVLPETRSEPRTPPAALSNERLRILIIDDEPTLLRGLRRMLGSEHDVVTAQGGREGIGRLETEGPFDVVLCDLMMPEVDGPAVHDWIETYAPELVGRVFYMSGGVFTDRTQAFSNRSGVHLVDKPLSKEELLELLREAG